MSKNIGYGYVYTTKPNSRNVGNGYYDPTKVGFVEDKDGEVDITNLF